MGNKQKTRKEKIIADLRRQLYSLGNQGVASSENYKPKHTGNSKVVTTTLNAYPYLLHDILKTGILTMSIVACQVILFLILKKHILVLPIVSY
jgi:hypothetical protein